MEFLGLITKLGGFVTGIDFNAVGNVLKTIGQSMIKYWYLWIIGLLLASNGLTGYELKHVQGALIKEQAAHTKDVEEFKTAQIEANNIAAATQAALIKESKADAEKADASYDSLLAQYRTNLLRYRTNQSATSQATDHQLPTAQSGNGSSPSANLSTWLRITADDAGICAVNTARLQAVHDWAVNLPKEVK